MAEPFTRIITGVWGNSHGIFLDVPVLFLTRASPADRKRPMVFFARRAMRELREMGFKGLLVAKMKGVSPE